MIYFRLSMYYMAYFALVGVTLPFFPVWLESNGLTPENIGIIIGFSTLVRAGVNPIFAHAADRSGAHKLIIVALTLSSILIFNFYFLSNSFWAILVVTIFFTSAWGATQPIAESLTTINLKKNQLDYGKIRLWGSVAFILVAATSGEIIERFGSEVILYLILTFLMFMLIAVIFMPKIPFSDIPKDRYPIIPLLRNIKFLLILVAAALIQSSHAVYYGFSALHWQKVGISETVIGLLWAEGVLAEIILFTLSANLLKSLNPIILIILGGIAGVLRWFGMGLGDDLPILFILQLLHGFTFGATHLGVIYFISHNISDNLSATAMSLYSAIAMGLVMGLMVMLSGHLYAAFQSAAFFIVAFVSAVGGCCAYLALKLNTPSGKMF